MLNKNVKYKTLLVVITEKDEHVIVGESENVVLFRDIFTFMSNEGTVVVPPVAADVAPVAPVVSEPSS